MGFDENTNIFPEHKIVRIVYMMAKFKDLVWPNKELILEEIKYFKKIKVRGKINIFYSFLNW